MRTCFLTSSIRDEDNNASEDSCSCLLYTWSNVGGSTCGDENVSGFSLMLKVKNNALKKIYKIFEYFFL